MISDEPTPGNPTLEDLGVKLSTFEQYGTHYLRMFDRFGYYKTTLDDAEEPPAPLKYVA